MKNRILILVVFILMSGNVFGQEDLQWLVRNESGKDGVFNLSTNKFDNNLNSTTRIQITGIDSPMIPEGENEYFAIFEDGSYSFVTNNKKDPIFDISTFNTIKYLYLTNKYEGDDVPDKVKAIPVSSMGTGPQFNGVTQDWHYTHDIILGKDITFVVNPSYYRTLFTTSSVKLCYEDLSGGAIVTFNKSGFNQGETKNVLLGNSMSILESGFTSNCIILPNVNGYVYLNFRPDYNNQAIGKKVKFSIKDANNPSKFRSIDSILVSSKFHDPNYVELKCVWRDKLLGKKFARYHVECFNDGNAGVDILKLTLNLPAKAKRNKVKINNWKAGITLSGCDQNVNLQVLPSSTQELTVQFIKTGGGTILEPLISSMLPDERHTAWFEFCVELNDDTNFLIDVLQPSTPKTTFSNVSGTEIYLIETFKDNIESYIIEGKPGKSYRRIEKECQCMCILNKDLNPEKSKKKNKE